MKYSVDKKENYLVFSVLEENLNSVIAPELKSTFVLISNQDVKNLILDLSKVNYVDSSGLSAILTAYRIWNEVGTFGVCNVQDTVFKLLQISKLDGIIKSYPSTKDAIDAIPSEASKGSAGSDN
jgi:anti-sigma B factor antagonist